MNRRNFVQAVGLCGVVGMLPFTLAGCDTSWIETAEQDLPEIGGVLGSVLGIVLSVSSPVLEPVAQAALKIAIVAAQEALVTLQAIVTDYKANPNASKLQKIQLAASDVAKNLSGILSAAHIDNPGLQSTIANGIAISLETIALIISLVPTKASSRLAVTSSKPKLLSASDIRAKYNKVAAVNGYDKYLIK